MKELIMKEIKDSLKTIEEVEDELRELLKKSTHYNNSKPNFEIAKTVELYSKNNAIAIKSINKV